MYNDYEDIITFARKFITDKCPEGLEKYIQPGEVFVDVTTDMVPGVYDYYQVSNFGRVYHNYLQIIMKPGLGTSGYNFIVLSTENGTKIVQLHRLVMIAFHDIPDRNVYQVNHINGDKTCNYEWNLEWVTRSENVLHAYSIGLKKAGEEHPNASITEDTAIKICELLQEGTYTNIQIANMMKTTPHIVSHIKQGENWRHISSNYIFPSYRPKKLFTDEQVHNICKYFQIYYKGDLTNNQYYKNALLYYGYDTSKKYIDAVREIYVGRQYTNISKNYNFNSIVQRLSPNGRRNSSIGVGLK